MSNNNIKLYDMCIGGEWVQAISRDTLPTINPATGETWAQVPAGGQGDVDRAVAAARAAFDAKSWRSMLGKQRGRLMRQLAEVIRRDADKLAAIETRDNGKLIRESQAQLRVIPDWYDYFAGLADKIQGETIPVDKPDMLNYTVRHPLGVVGAIVPWNSPLLIAAYKLAPALAAGNTIVLKPAEQTSVSALEFARLAIEVGFPPGVINVVTGYGHAAGAALSAHPGINKLTFTGGTVTGRRVAAAAGANTVPLTLELGGKSPQLVFADADLARVTNGVLAGIFAACGQSCVAGARLFAHESIIAELTDRISARAKSIVIGDPANPASEMGPLAFAQQLERCESYVRLGVKEGARLLLGGQQPAARQGQGFFFEPTIFVDVRNDMRIAQEEIFGPVLCITPFKVEAEAVALANDSSYGLAAGVWTQDIQRAHRVAQQLQAGTIWINAYRIVSHASPMGGYKNSGYGRENGLQAINDFTTLKSVWIDLSDETSDPFSLRI